MIRVRKGTSTFFISVDSNIIATECVRHIRNKLLSDHSISDHTRFFSVMGQAVDDWTPLQLLFPNGPMSTPVDLLFLPMPKVDVLPKGMVSPIVLPTTILGVKRPRGQDRGGGDVLSNDTAELIMSSYPIVLGNVATYDHAEGNRSWFNWTVYLRGVFNEDLSALIEAVSFTLHSDFDTPHRVLHSPPFEVSERGWGEFLIAITVKVRHVAQEIPLQHYLVFSHRKRPERNLPPRPLNPPYTTGLYEIQVNPVVAELPDELVFVNVAEGSELRSCLSQQQASEGICSPNRGVSKWSSIVEHSLLRKEFCPGARKGLSSYHPTDEVAVLRKELADLNKAVAELDERILVTSAAKVAHWFL